MAVKCGSILVVITMKWYFTQAAYLYDTLLQVGESVMAVQALLHGRRKETVNHKNAMRRYGNVCVEIQQHAVQS
jgi:hypothetical protein